jgi:hypothetical protein
VLNNIFLKEKRAVLEMLKIILERGRPQITTRLVRFACSITEITHTKRREEKRREEKRRGETQNI